MQYKVLSAMSPETLSTVVNEYTIKNWEPLGGIITVQKTRGIEYLQTIINKTLSMEIVITISSYTCYCRRTYDRTCDRRRNSIRMFAV